MSARQAGSRGFESPQHRVAVSKWNKELVYETRLCRFESCRQYQGVSGAFRVRVSRLDKITDFMPG